MSLSDTYSNIIWAEKCLSPTVSLNSDIFCIGKTSGHAGFPALSMIGIFNFSYPFKKGIEF